MEKPVETVDNFCCSVEKLQYYVSKRQRLNSKKIDQKEKTPSAFLLCDKKREGVYRPKKFENFLKKRKKDFPWPVSQMENNRRKIFTHTNPQAGCM